MYPTLRAQQASPEQGPVAIPEHRAVLGPLSQSSQCLIEGNEDASSALGGVEEGKLWGEREISLCMSFPFVFKNCPAGLGLK